MERSHPAQTALELPDRETPAIAVISCLAGARSQGSNPWQTQVMVLDVPLLSHFPLDLVLYLRYKTPIGLTLWLAGWRRHGTAI